MTTITYKKALLSAIYDYIAGNTQWEDEDKRILSKIRRGKALELDLDNNTISIGKQKIRVEFL